MYNSIWKHFTLMNLWYFSLICAILFPPLRIHNSRSSLEWTVLSLKKKCATPKTFSNYAKPLTCTIVFPATAHLPAKPVGLLLYYKKNTLFSLVFVWNCCTHCFQIAKERNVYKNCVITESHFKLWVFFCRFFFLLKFRSMATLWEWREGGGYFFFFRNMRNRSKLVGGGAGGFFGEIER